MWLRDRQEVRAAKPTRPVIRGEIESLWIEMGGIWEGTDLRRR